VVDLFELLVAEPTVGLAPSLDFVIEVTPPDKCQYQLAGFADGFTMDDAAQAVWKRMGNLEETLSFDLYGEIVEHEQCAGYRAHISVNAVWSRDQFESFDRGVVGFGSLDETNRFSFKLALPAATAKNLFEMVNHYASRETDENGRKLVRLIATVINLRKVGPKKNLMRVVYGFDLLRLSL
jgi:hypothetical protein